MAFEPKYGEGGCLRRSCFEGVMKGQAPREVFRNVIPNVVGGCLYRHSLVIQKVRVRLQVLRSVRMLGSQTRKERWRSRRDERHYGIAISA